VERAPRPLNLTTSKILSIRNAPNQSSNESEFPQFTNRVPHFSRPLCARSGDFDFRPKSTDGPEIRQLYSTLGPQSHPFQPAGLAAMSPHPTYYNS